MKFTLAHELGHWFLHEKEYQSIKYSSEEEFIKIQKSLNALYRKSFEIQANMFAAYLLVPTDSLIEHTNIYLTKIKQGKLKDEGELRLLQNEIAEELSNNFGVSAEVINNRMFSERVLDLRLQMLK